LAFLTEPIAIRNAPYGRVEATKMKQKVAAITE